MREIIKKEVATLKKKYNTNDPFELCDYLNIDILYDNLGSVNGFYQLTDGRKIIHLNKTLDEHKSRITCAHELGHALLHADLNICFLKEHTFFNTAKLEHQADYFMVQLLVEDGIFENCEYSGLTIMQVAQSIGIPADLLKLKIL